MRVGRLAVGYEQINIISGIATVGPRLAVAVVCECDKVAVLWYHLHIGRVAMVEHISDWYQFGSRFDYVGMLFLRGCFPEAAVDRPERPEEQRHGVIVIACRVEHTAVHRLGGSAERLELFVLVGRGVSRVVRQAIHLGLGECREVDRHGIQPRIEGAPRLASQLVKSPNNPKALLVGRGKFSQRVHDTLASLIVGDAVPDDTGVEHHRPRNPHEHRAFGDGLGKDQTPVARAVLLPHHAIMHRYTRLARPRRKRCHVSSNSPGCRREDALDSDRER